MLGGWGGGGGGGAADKMYTQINISNKSVQSNQTIYFCGEICQKEKKKKNYLAIPFISPYNLCYNNVKET